jgi:hypothetical protein
VSLQEAVEVTLEAYERFITSAVSEVSWQKEVKLRKEAAIKRLRDGVFATIDKDAAIEKNWRDCADNSEKVIESKYLQQHAGFLHDLVCNATTNRRAIAAGITELWVTNEPKRRAYASRLARDFLGVDGKECAATKELSEQTKERLRKFASFPIPAN